MSMTKQIGRWGVSLAAGAILGLGAGCVEKIPPEIEQARQRVEAGDSEGAAMALKKRAFDNPKNWEGWNDLGAMELTRGRIEPAKAFLMRAVGADPLQPAPHNNLGLVYLKLGKPEAAMEEFLLAVAAVPEYTEAHYNLGVIYRNAGLYDRAEASFNAVLKHKPGHPMARYHRGFVRVLTGRFDEALADFKPLLKDLPEKAGVHYGYGLGLKGKGDKKGALESLAKAVHMDPENPEYRLDYGAALLSSGAPDAPARCEAEFLKVLELAPDFPRAVYLLALFYDDAQRYDKAIPLYRKSIEQGYLADRARLNLADALRKSGQAEAAPRSQPR